MTRTRTTRSTTPTETLDNELDSFMQESTETTDTPPQDTPEAQVRAKRDYETRETAERSRSWAPPQLLPEPDKEAGYMYRWVRTTSAERGYDGRNLMTKRREGWEPVRVEEQPQFAEFLSKDGVLDDCIEVGDLVLCKAPEDMMRQRSAHYASKNKAQLESVDQHYLRDEDARMPKFSDRSSKVSKFGTGS